VLGERARVVGNPKPETQTPKHETEHYYTPGSSESWIAHARGGAGTEVSSRRKPETRNPNPETRNTNRETRNTKHNTSSSHVTGTKITSTKITTHLDHLSRGSPTREGRLEQRARVVRCVQRLRYHLQMISFNCLGVYHKSPDSGTNTSLEARLAPGLPPGRYVAGGSRTREGMLEERARVVGRVQRLRYHLQISQIRQTARTADAPS